MKIGFLGVLGLIFITLKLTGVIAWSWFWVLSPIFAIPALLLFFLVVVPFVTIGILGVGNVLSETWKKIKK